MSKNSGKDGQCKDFSTSIASKLTERRGDVLFSLYSIIALQ